MKTVTLEYSKPPDDLDVQIHSESGGAFMYFTSAENALRAKKALELVEAAIYTNTRHRSTEQQADKFRIERNTADYNLSNFLQTERDIRVKYEKRFGCD